MNRHISLRQLRLLQMMAILPTTLVFLPGQTFEKSGTGALYAAILAAVGAFVINIAVLWSSHGASPGRLFHKSWGNLVGRCVMGIYALGILTGIISIWNELFTFVQASVLPRTPEWAIGILVWGVLAAAVSGGAPGLARLTDLLTVGAILLGLVVLVPVMGYVRPVHFVPFLPPSLMAIGKGAWLPMTFLGESVVGVAFLDSARGVDPHQRSNAILQGTFISAGVFVGIVMLLWGVLGAGFAASQSFPILEAIRDVRLSQFLSRFDIVFVPLWVALVELKLAIWMFIAVNSVRRAVRWGSSRLWMVLLGGATGAIASLGFTSVVERIAFLKATWGEGAFPVLVLLLLISGLASKFRGVHDG